MSCEDAKSIKEQDKVRWRQALVVAVTWKEKMDVTMLDQVLVKVHKWFHHM